MKKCLISGATGLIGKCLVNCLSKNFEVYSLQRSDNVALFPINVRRIVCDLENFDDYDSLPKKIDTVIHLAQSEDFRNFPEKAESIFSINTVSTLKLLEYARRAGARTFVYASSGIVYGNGNNPFRDDPSLNIQSQKYGFYYTSKICSEAIAQCYEDFMTIINLRFFFVYGPGQRNTMLIPRLVHSIRESRPITLDGESGILINPIYVTDTIQAIEKSLFLRESNSINIGGKEVLSLMEVTSIIAELLKKEVVYEFRRELEPQSLLGDITKMKNLLIAPKISFREGISKYLQMEASR